MELNSSVRFFKTNEDALTGPCGNSANQLKNSPQLAQTSLQSPLSVKSSSLGHRYSDLSQKSMLETIHYLEEQLEKRDNDISSLLKDKFTLSLEIMELNTSRRYATKRGLNPSKVAVALFHANAESSKPTTYTSPTRKHILSQSSSDCSMNVENLPIELTECTGVTQYLDESEKYIIPCKAHLQDKINICIDKNADECSEDAGKDESEKHLSTLNMEVLRLKSCVQSLSALVQAKTDALENAKAETSNIVHLHRSIFLPQIETASLALSQMDSVINELEVSQRENQYLRQKALTAEELYQKLGIKEGIIEECEVKLLESQRDAKEWREKYQLLNGKLSELHSNTNESPVEVPSKLQVLENALDVAEKRIVKLQNECNKGRLALERESQRLSLLKDYYEGAVTYTEQLLKAEILKNTSVA